MRKAVAPASQQSPSVAMGPGLRRDDTEFVAPLVAHTSAFSRHDLSESCFSFRPPLEQRAQGKPGADRTHGPRAMGRKLGGRTTGVTGNTPAFRARWVEFGSDLLCFKRTETKAWSMFSAGLLRSLFSSGHINSHSSPSVLPVCGRNYFRRCVH